MSLGILNNISALYAQNSLNSTQNSLQNTLQQLSSGSRINSGADDAAGLAVADGLHANEAALTQSSQNATAGIGLLQTADGALSQVTNLLDRAVTLATESANGTLTAGQVSSANQEYQNILSQIGNIGSTTNFNSSSVFSSQATNIVVTDGTSSGLNVYADTVGQLTTASVGTSAGTAVVATPLTSTNIVTTQANAGSTRVAGQYTLAAFAATDTVSGQLSFTVGNSNAQQHDVNVAPGTTLTQLRDQLNNSTPAFTAAGLQASINGAGALVIAGPTSGANIAANSVSFANTNLTDTLTPAAITNTGSTAGAAGSSSTGQLTFVGAATNDTFSGHIVLTQGSESLDITIASGSKSGLASDSTTIQGQIAAAIAGQDSTSHFTVATQGGTTDNPVLKFTGSNNTTAITITNTLTDAVTSSGVSYTPAGAAGTNPTAATYSLSALSTGTDTFGTGSTLTIGTQDVHLDGMTATAAATAISADSVLSGLGISASAASGHLVISGKSDGTALPSITGLGTLKDVSSVMKPNLSAVATTSAPQGSVAVAAGNTVISMLGAGDTLAGSLSITVGTGGAAKTAALTINSGTSGQALATQITQNASFIAAGIGASFSSVNNTITLSGPGGTTPPAIAVNGSTSITESTVSTPGVGANFTNIGVSQLTTATAAAVLTTVTAAVADVAYQRGTIGADINQLTSASNVASAQGVNLSSAEESIRATNYGQAASDLSKYQILSQTGISALAQANSVQQEVLKLLQ